MYGDGAQSLFHVWLHLRYFTAIEEVAVVVGLHRTLTPEEVKEKERRFKGQLGALLNHNDDNSIGAVAVTFLTANNSSSTGMIETALGQADIICTCTPSTTSLFINDDLVDPKTGLRLPKSKHAIAVGSYKPHMCELPRGMIVCALHYETLLVDSAKACEEEAGCLIQAFQPSPSDWNLSKRLVEIGTLLPFPSSKDGAEEDWMEKLEEAGARWRKEKRRWQRGVWLSVFKSVGMGLQDVEMTKLIVRLAGESVGTMVDF